ncbi:DNA phosphorothioation system sulfurtransferase DndC [Paenibacillus kyungheensis]|uniref:DNA phosphorothioation system sulfurtransferase DndC n=1 Tax=Paenibacillus kyungheensis TaxID=1452732 RepID=A0AAX3M3C4_9BACL|nr:DNA phosphorothioation system sulfurtransferase DndC [Paenibacillus kyungheensis]WCT56765.1 DNA phosphorothioation system sulfurtransferase DndC [Paenibacillus kyungheensis]
MELNIFNTGSKFVEAKELVKEMYLEDERPWVVGFSGGKDSTAVVQIVFQALQELEPSQLHKKVYVISSDTQVETPLIIDKITRTLGRIEKKALEIGLPFETQKVRPKAEQTFWSSIIGKGYPTPRQKFRWCTDRLKIEPANRFILDKVDQFGEVVMLLGVRDSESATRAAVMQSHTIEGKKLMKHSTLRNAFVFAPIRSFSVDDVWEFLLQYESPWGDDNNELLQLYQDSSSECPLVVDKEVKESAGSCGNSRFGCWTCTVVTEDKALSGFINNGVDWLRPLYDFRNFLVEVREDRSKRQKRRMNGEVYLTTNLGGIDPQDLSYPRIYKSEIKEYIDTNNINLATIEDLDILVIDEDDNNTPKRFGVGPFTLDAREEILRKLLRTQKEIRELHDPTIELITVEELKAIRKYWHDDLQWEDRLPQIVEEETGEVYDWQQDDRPVFKEDQLTDLETLCQEEGVNLSLLKKLISVEKDYSGVKIRRGLFQAFDKTLKQDFLHL